MLLKGPHETTHKQKRAIKLQIIQKCAQSTHRHTDHTQLNKDSKQLDTLPLRLAENTLPRFARIRFAQLSIGYCPLLNSYLSRICNNCDNRHPECEVATHDVNRIFNCIKNTTDLKVVDLL